MNGKSLEDQRHDIATDYIASMTDDYFIDLFKIVFPSDQLLGGISYIGYFDVIDLKDNKGNENTINNDIYDEDIEVQTKYMDTGVMAASEVEIRDALYGALEGACNEVCRRLEERSDIEIVKRMDIRDKADSGIFVYAASKENKDDYSTK